MTQAILAKQYSNATRIKQEIEERQRQKAATRKEADREWRPRFFINALAPRGKPDLTEDGKEALKGLRDGSFKLEENKELAA